MRCRSLALVPLAAWLLGTPAAPEGPNADGEALIPGSSLERSIASGEKHVYRVEVTDAPLLLTIEQRGIDLVVEAQRAGEPTKTLTDALNGRWGMEVLLLPAEAAGEYRLEVHPGPRSVPSGRYAIQLEELSTVTEEGKQRAAAMAAMSRAGQLAAGDPAALSQALVVYREALAAWRALGDRRWQAEGLHALAGVEGSLWQLPAAAEDYGGALALWHDLLEPRREAAVLAGLGATRVKAGETAAASAALEKSLALWRRLGERFDAANVRRDLCVLEQTSGDLHAALSCFEEVRSLFRDLGDDEWEALILNSLGGIYDLMGEPEAALSHYEQALALWRARGKRQGEAQTLGNLAVIYRGMGDWQEALRLYEQVRQVLASLDEPGLESARLYNVGFLYLSLGEPERALPLLEEALTLRRQAGARRDMLITLNGLGIAWRNLGDVKKSLDYHRQALELAKDLKDSRQEASTRFNLADAQLDHRNPLAALTELEPALAYFKEKGLRKSELQALQLQGQALAVAGRPKEALPVFQQALAGCRALRDRPGEPETLRSLAAAECSLGLREEARGHAEAAVAKVEELRNAFVNPSLRASFLATRRQAFSLLIDLDMDRHRANPGGGYDRAAFEVSEQTRARSLLDVLGVGGVRHASSAVPAGLVERRQLLRRRLSAKADQQVTQADAKNGRAETLGREIETLLAELDGVEAEIQHHDPQYAAVSKAQPIAVEEVVRLLDPGTLLLEYSLGEARSYLWAISSEGLHSFDLPPQREIEDLARRVYEELSTVESGSGRRPQAVEALSRILLRPVWNEAAHARRLAVVPDGVLHLLPFAALPVPGPGQGWNASDGWKPLLDSHEVVALPSATTLAAQRRRLEQRPPATKWAAVLADPVFASDDLRFARPPVARQQPRTSGRQEPARGGETRGLLPVFERLPSSRREAERIAQLLPAGQVRTALDFAASRESVLAGEFRPYRIIHFATHGVADTRNPELSGLILSLVDATGHSREGFLSLSDIYGLDLDADLVVLSGCRTALGKQVRGEGIMSLTRGFLYAGVPRVVASLWKVEDRATAELMARFYRAMWRDRLPPAAALRTAQRSLRQEPRYRSPYSWAGFVLQGDWR